MKWISIVICLASVSAAQLPIVLSRTGSVRTETVTLKALDAEHQYSVLYSISPLRNLTPDARVIVELRQGQSILAAKTLHSGDADYATPRKYRSHGRSGLVQVRVHRRCAQAGLLSSGLDGARSDSSQRIDLSNGRRRPQRIFRRRRPSHAAARSASAAGKQIHA